MRVPPDKPSNKASKKSAASERPVEAQRADDWASIEAELEKNPFHKGNTAGGRKPPYKPEYVERAKEMCERGATLDEVAEVLGVSPKTIRIWQISHDDFFEACKVTPGCVERAKRNIFDIAMGQKVTTDKIVESGSQRQTTKVTNNLPANLGASKSFVPDEVIRVVGEIEQLLMELQGTRVRPKREDGSEVSEAEFPGKRRPPQQE